MTYNITIENNKIINIENEHNEQEKTLVIINDKVTLNADDLDNIKGNLLVVEITDETSQSEAEKLIHILLKELLCILKI